MQIRGLVHVHVAPRRRFSNEPFAVMMGSSCLLMAQAYHSHALVAKNGFDVTSSRIHLPVPVPEVWARGDIPDGRAPTTCSRPLADGLTDSGTPSTSSPRSTGTPANPLKTGYPAKCRCTLKKNHRSSRWFLAIRLNSRSYFALCLIIRRRFFRLCVAILCFFLFLPQGIDELLCLWLPQRPPWT